MIEQAALGAIEQDAAAGARGRHTAFDADHPSVGATYLVATIALTMASLEPVLVAISLAGGLVYSLAARGAAATLAGLRWQLPLVLLVAVMNPLVSASGSTELFRLGERAVYLESLCFGCTMGALLVASALWFQAAALILPFDRSMALLGNAFPTIALMVSQGMRLVPLLVRRGHEVLAAQEAAVLPGARRMSSTRGLLRLSTVLLGWSLEDSLGTADAMRARGWSSSRRRTTYTRYRFTARDALALAAVALSALVVAVASAAVGAGFAFYPTMSPLGAWWGYVPCALWMLAPSVLHVIEERRYA